MDKKVLPAECMEKGQALLDAIDKLRTELVGYMDSGFKAAGRRTRSALTKVTKAGKPFRASSLEADGGEAEAE